LSRTCLTAGPALEALICSPRRTLTEYAVSALRNRTAAEDRADKHNSQACVLHLGSAHRYLLERSTQTDSSSDGSAYAARERLCDDLPEVDIAPFVERDYKPSSSEPSRLL
jgi:hypothetical protein